MIEDKKVIVMDIDGTLAIEKENWQSYHDVSPCKPVLDKLLNLKLQGWRIILYTSRNMRTYSGNIGEINTHTAPLLFDWLKINSIPYDELHFGKPWCGHDGFYVDDKAIRPKEFATMSLNEINELISNGKY